jgi:hypothetical protein
MTTREVVLRKPVRTAIGSFNGSLKGALVLGSTSPLSRARRPGRCLAASAPGVFPGFPERLPVPTLARAGGSSSNGYQNHQAEKRRSDRVPGKSKRPQGGDHQGQLSLAELRFERSESGLHRPVSSQTILARARLFGSAGRIEGGGRVR